MIFLSQKLMEIWYLLITEKFLFCSFRQWEIRPFFKRKNWWKYDIYWLLKRCIYWLLTVFFWVKKLTERWSLLVTEKFLFWTFRWLESTVLFSAKKLMERWYLVFLSFSWYSRTWEIWFFEQCFTSWKRRKHRPLSFFPQDTRHAFLALSKSTAIGVEFQKFTKVWERSPQNWSKTFTGTLIIPWISFNQIVRQILWCRSKQYL